MNLVYGATMADLPRRVNDCRLIFVSLITHLAAAKRLIVKGLSRQRTNCRSFVRNVHFSKNRGGFPLSRRRI
jgi:hypothetical protein